jgi:DMSO/TMAO reductase YedYZ molybdopterin-dependent catalytic subunit
MVETKLKNSKVIVATFVTDDYSGSYWEDQGYNWFSGS